MRIVVLCALALVVLGCTATKGTGGGWIASVQAGQRATFGFNAHCDPRGPQPPDLCVGLASGHYEDNGPIVPVRMALTVITSSLGAHCQTAAVEYRSQVLAAPGTGHAAVTVCDNDLLPRVKGEPRVADTFEITVASGPFAGYTNRGPLLGGNIAITLAPTPPPAP